MTGYGAPTGTAGSSTPPAVETPQDDNTGWVVAPEQPTMAPGTGSQSGSAWRSPSAILASAGPLAPGGAFGTRYHIIRLLGIGGMGAVYQAWDDELGVALALKVIRPEVTADPNAAKDLERRFKRELLLARQVTHKNVVRIHDLGEIDGIKYLTMPYIQGSDLSSVLVREGKLPMTRAIGIARQVASGLQAAHEVGVVHRDLKPANIMIDADGVAVIMDFGIARSVSGGGATMAGAVVGTLEYMAPEQAMAHPVDQRADIYALGLILRDMVLGVREAARAESAVAELMARIQRPLMPVRAMDPSVPEAIERIIDRCTQPEPGARYQSTAELAHDLDLLDGAGRAPATATLSAPPITRTAAAVTPAAAARPGWQRPALIAGVGVLLVAGVLGIVQWRGGFTGARPTTASGPTSLAILPFRNAASDPSMDWLGKVLADMVRSELGNAPGLRIVPSDRLTQMLTDLRIAPDSTLDSITLNRLFEFSNTEVLVAGQFARAGQAIQLQATLQRRGASAVPLQAEAAGDSDLPAAVQRLAKSLREGLTIAPDASAAARSSLPGPTSSSIAALRAYSEGEQLARDNKNQEALVRFQAAVKEDPQFALAFAKLAQTHQALGYGNDADQAIRQATRLAETLPQEQRYLIDAIHAGISNDTDKAIDAYERLRQLAPNDSQLLFDLARLYDGKGNLDGARDLLKRVLELDPKYVAALIQLGQVEIRRRSFDEALKYLQPAFSESVQTGNEPAKGAALHAIGVAFKRLNKPADALANYEQALKIRRGIDDRRGVAATLSEIGQVQMALQQTDAAIASYRESLKIRQDIGDRRGVGNTLIELGSVSEQLEDYDKAIDYYRQSLQIQTDLGNEAYQGLCQNNIASIHLLEGRYDDALTYFQQALQIREKSRVSTDIAETLQGLGDTQARIGQFDPALTNYLRALDLRRKANDERGAAQVSAGMAAVFSARGRYGAALDSYEEALKAFRGSPDSRSLAGILAGYAGTLAMVGRNDAAAEATREATALARDAKAARLTARVLNTEGDRLFFQGDYKGARAQFEQAAKTTGKASHPDLEMLTSLNLAKTSVRDGRAAAAVGALRDLAARTDTMRLRPLSAEATLYLGEALLATRDNAGARRQLETAIALADKLTLVPIATSAHYLLGTVLTQAGDKAGATRHYNEARTLLETMRKEARSDDLLKREDLRRISAAPAS